MIPSDTKKRDTVGYKRSQEATGDQDHGFSLKGFQPMFMQVLSDSTMLERETGIEPVTSSLGSWRSTAELLPLNFVRLSFRSIQDNTRQR